MEKQTMALETLNGVEKLGSFDIVVMDDLRAKFPEKFNESGAMDWHWFESEIRPKHFIYLRNDKNSLSFTFQDGPVKEVGVNGCQVDCLIEAAAAIIGGLNAKYPSGYNALALEHLRLALESLAQRTKDREARGVEGQSAV